MPEKGYFSVTLEERWGEVAAELVSSGHAAYREIAHRKNYVATVLADLMERGLQEVLRDLGPDAKARVLRAGKAASLFEFATEEG